MINHFTATGFVFNSDDKVLMIKHKKLGVWLPPGGHIDENELPCDAVRREIFEETGIRARVISAADALPNSGCRELALPMEILLEDIEGDGTHNHIDMIYLCRADDGSLRPQTAEIDDIGWFAVAEFDKLQTFENTKASVKKAFMLLKNKELRDR